MAPMLAPVQNMQFPSSLVLQKYMVPPVTPACVQHVHCRRVIAWAHVDAQAEFCNSGVSGDVQLVFVLENCFLFICCKYSITPLQNQFTSCFISCLSACWRCMEELTREKGKPVNATGYHKSHSNYLRDVADHTGQML